MKKITWEEISLKKYNEILEIIASNDDEFTRLAHIASCIFGKNVEDIPITEMNRYIHSVSELVKQPLKQVDLKKKYTLNGRVYRMIKFADMSMAQFMDYQELAKDVENNVHRICAIFLVPEGHKYNEGYDLDEASEDMLEMPIQDVSSLAFFLQGQLKNSLKATNSFLIAQVLMTKNLKWKEKKMLVKEMFKVWQSLDHLIS